MFNASSNQSFVRDGADYEEVYPSGYRDQDDLSEERSLSASSLSSTSEDMELAEPKEGSDVDEDQRVKFVVGANGLMELIMLPKWMVNAFTSTIKEPHFNTLRAHY